MKIDKEFESLIPPLSADEFQQLEENCIKEGIRDSLVIWDDGIDWILIDGHNRYKIAQKHNLPYNHKRMEFPDRDAVKRWIILNQFGRRNLSAYDRSLLALKLKPVIADKAKDNERRGGGSGNSGRQKSDNPTNTAKELAKVAGVSHDTIHKVETIEKKATPRTKQLVREGKLSINQAYNSVAPKRPDPVKIAREEHEEFIEKKHEAVINMSDVQMDKLNQQIINGALLQEVLEVLNKVDGFGMRHKTKELQSLHDMVKDDERKVIIDRCMTCRGVLMAIANNIM